MMEGHAGARIPLRQPPDGACRRPEHELALDRFPGGHRVGTRDRRIDEVEGLEVVAVGVGVLIASYIALDGKSNWVEGLQLVSVYLIVAIAFFFLT